MNGGPAGTVLALLLARQGISVMLLEAHRDFDRDFRGDTLQPSAMEIMAQMGLGGSQFCKNTRKRSQTGRCRE